METTKRIPTSVYAEMTPNPAAMKFVADRALISGGMQVEYRSKNEAKGSSPLAEELFNFPFVQSVFISGNYVTVLKDESLGWEMIVQQLREYIREWLVENAIVVSAVTADLLHRTSDNSSGVDPVAAAHSSAIDYGSFSPSEYDEEIKFLLNEYVRPAVESDGGAIDFMAYKDKKVYVQLKGSCSGCPSSTATLKGGIENLLKARLPEIVKLQTGMWANFFISSKSIFEDGVIIHENWVQGERYVIDEAKSIDLAGRYQLQLPLHTYDLTVKNEAGKLKSEIQHIKRAADGSGKMDTLKYNVNIQMTNELLTVSFEPNDEFYSGVLRLAGDINVARQNWQGKGEDAKGVWFDWSCSRMGDTPIKGEDKKETPASAEILGSVIYPFSAYGVEKRPEAETVLIKNATVWTCDKAGKIQNGQVLISRGKIVAVGSNLDVSAYPDRKEIDAQGKHVTPGIIDEHSHIALASVNEGTQACSAEVEEASVLAPEDIDIYRQLSGGVTCSQLLHGSANPIGGQSALVKWHWGGNAEDLLIDNAPKFIKFALGENVKQSNWSNDGIRFPQTRMGVEQIYYDHFIRAREYSKAMAGVGAVSAAKGKKTTTVQPVLVRRDLEMDALNEILEKKRFVTCHSYVQSEINMLMHVADSMHFTLNTFTHILEGYKVADKMKAHGAGASSFSDWWAYKYEVKDAIPYNGALLWEQGITVAFNSDDAEMARRLNQEAAKAVKYGGVPEEEALKFVTLNPAKLLHIDARTGSLVAGKDADVVIWSDNPLSIYAKVEQTFVDGIRYFDHEEDLQRRLIMDADRSRLIQKMMSAKLAGEPTQQPAVKEKKHFHCDTLDETSKGVSFK